MVPQRLHLPGRPAIAAASGEQAGERLGEQAARLPAAPAGSSSEAKRWREDNKRKDVKSGPFSQEEKDTLRRAVEDYAGAPCVPAVPCWAPSRAAAPGWEDFTNLHTFQAARRPPRGALARVRLALRLPGASLYPLQCRPSLVLMPTFGPLQRSTT